MQDFETPHHGIRAVIEIGDHPQLEITALQFRKDLGGFGKQDPTFGTAKSVVQLFEEFVEIIDHSYFGKNSVNNVLPPPFLIFNRQRPCAAKLARESGLDYLV